MFDHIVKLTHVNYICSSECCLQRPLLATQFCVTKIDFSEERWN